MTRYIVCWTNNGIFSESQMKVFESRDPANWFAQSIEKHYNNVKVYLARKESLMTKKRILTLVTGGFDPLHSGHIAYFEQAKDLTNYLVVGLNTEEWLTKKKGQYFMSWKERAEIIRHLDVLMP